MDSSTLHVGAIGTPYGQRETATFGTVSGLNRTESESPDGPAALLTGLVQTSAPIAPGNSGGALVNMQGQLIGIPTLGATSQQTQTSGLQAGDVIVAVNGQPVTDSTDLAERWRARRRGRP